MDKHSLLEGLASMVENSVFETQTLNRIIPALPGIR